MPKKKHNFIAHASTPFFLSGVALVVVALYIGFVTYPLVSGSSLQVNQPTLTENGTTLISGTTSRISSLFINDSDVPLTEAGRFSVERSFPSGYTVVVLRAEDRFGRTREKTTTFITQ